MKKIISVFLTLTLTAGVYTGWLVGPLMAENLIRFETKGGVEKGTIADDTGNSRLTNVELVATDLATGTVPDARLSTNVTLEGNTFNGADQLVQLDGSGDLPAIDGSALTGITAATADALSANPSDCSSGEVSLGIDADGTAVCAPTTNALVNGSTDPFTSDGAFDHDANASAHSAGIAGNSGTATALAANGANCAASSFPLGVDASGAVESCSTSISGNSATATALAANGSNAASGFLCAGVDAAGNCEPAVILDSLTNGATSPVTSNALFDHDADASAHHTATVDTTAKDLCADGNFLRGEASTTCRSATQIVSDGGGLTSIDASDVGAGTFPTGVFDFGGSTVTLGNVEFRPIKSEADICSSSCSVHGTSGACWNAANDTSHIYKSTGTGAGDWQSLVSSVGPC